MSKRGTFGAAEGETVRAATSDAVTTATSRPIMTALLVAVFRRVTAALRRRVRDGRRTPASPHPRQTPLSVAKRRLPLLLPLPLRFSRPPARSPRQRPYCAHLLQPVQL